MTAGPESSEVLAERFRSVQQRRALTRALIWAWVTIAATASAGFLDIGLLWVPTVVLAAGAGWQAERSTREPKTPGEPR